jgi:hypothetical protein
MGEAGAVAAAEGAICRPVHGLASGDGTWWGTYEEERFGVGRKCAEAETIDCNYLLLARSWYEYLVEGV